MGLFSWPLSLSPEGSRVGRGHGCRLDSECGSVLAQCARLDSPHRGQEAQAAGLLGLLRKEGLA